MPVTSSGVRILGAPVGSVEFCQSFANELIGEFEKDFDVLGRMPSFQAQLLVATKSVVHRINQLLRNIPGGEISLFGEIAASYDSTVLSVIHRVTGLSSLPDISRRICQLPPRKGGIGLRTWSTTADSAFLAAYTHASNSFPVLFPDRPYLAEMTPDPRALFQGDPSRAPSASPSTWAGWAARALTRIHSKAPGILEVLAPASGQTPRSLQHAISRLTDDADSLSLISALQRVDDPKMPWRQPVTIPTAITLSCQLLFRLIPLLLSRMKTTKLRLSDASSSQFTILIVGRRLYVRDVRRLQTLGVSVPLLNLILTYSETMRCVAQVLVVALGLNSGTTHLS